MGLRDTIREQIDKEIRRNEQKDELMVVSINMIDELIASRRDINTIGDSNAKNNRESKGINNGSDNKQKAEASYVSQRRKNEDVRNVPKNNKNNQNESNEQAKNNIRENHKESKSNSNASNADNRNKSKSNTENDQEIVGTSGGAHVDMGEGAG